MAIAAEHGIEGIVAKRADSIYRPGVRSKSWLKTPIRHSGDGIICVYVGSGGRAGGPLAALLLGAATRAAIWSISAVLERFSPIRYGANCPRP
ncbi:ATP-dependent DNA ligase [Rhodococcus sp. 06-156-3C]